MVYHSLYMVHAILVAAAAKIFNQTRHILLFSTNCLNINYHSYYYKPTLLHWKEKKNIISLGKDDQIRDSAFGCFSLLGVWLSRASARAQFDLRVCANTAPTNFTLISTSKHIHCQQFLCIILCALIHFLPIFISISSTSDNGIFCSFKPKRRTPH